MIRVAAIDDLPAVVAIYNEAVASRISTADMVPVAVESRRDWLNEHDSRSHPIYVWEDASEIKAGCSLSPYRRGRMALRHTAEISYYVRTDCHRKGIATMLVRYACEACPSLQIKNLFAIVLEPNAGSQALLEKLEFERWGFLPRVADFDGQECGHVYYGRRIAWPDSDTRQTNRPSALRAEGDV